MRKLIGIVYEQHELAGLGSVHRNHDGSAPSNRGVRASIGTTAVQPAAANLAAPTTMDQGRRPRWVLSRQKDLIKFLSPRTPVVETYLQNLTQDPQLGPIPAGRSLLFGPHGLQCIDRPAATTSRTRRRRRTKKKAWSSACSAASPRSSSSNISPSVFPGWSSPTATNLTGSTMISTTARREFLGDVRCLVFDLTPKKDAGRGRFVAAFGSRIRISTSSQPQRNLLAFQPQQLLLPHG